MAASHDVVSMLTQDALTQTQPVESQLMRALSHCPPIACARLIPIAGEGLPTHEMRVGDKEVTIGRKDTCNIVVEDKRVSALHVRIYVDDSLRYFVEQLSPNGSWVNEQLMKKGDKRGLHSGDRISLCMHANETRQKPFAAFVFQVGKSQQPPQLPIAGKMAPQLPIASRLAAVATPQLAAAESDTTVSEQWVRDRWELGSLLGTGAFSEVRLGVNVATGEKRAVKIINKVKFQGFQRGRNSGLSLQCEVDMVMKLQHPGIVGFDVWFETRRSLYIVMELLEGGDLLDFIVQHGCLSEPLARRFFQELCDAVCYLHANDVVHRDLKPENIMLSSPTEDAHVKIVDFGLSRADVRRSHACQTFCGTPQYFAPEIISTFKERQQGISCGYGKQVDMWSLGVILYIMLSGMPPFDAEDDGSVGGLYGQILSGRFAFDDPAWAGVSPEGKELVQQLIVVNPRERLTVQQALEHPWLRVQPTPSDSKRRRTE